MNARETEICLHHWRIETPGGPTCHAICLRCGSEREFRTAADDQWVTKAERESSPQ